jgi:hypothetical protein
MAVADVAQVYCAPDGAEMYVAVCCILNVNVSGVAFGCNVPAETVDRDWTCRSVHDHCAIGWDSDVIIHSGCVAGKRLLQIMGVEIDSRSALSWVEFNLIGSQGSDYKHLVGGSCVNRNRAEIIGYAHAGTGADTELEFLAGLRRCGDTCEAQQNYGCQFCARIPLEHRPLLRNTAIPLRTQSIHQIVLPVDTA